MATRTATRPARAFEGGRAKPLPPPRETASEIRFSGLTVLEVIGSVYPTALQAALESIQNAIDAGGNRIDIRIDLYGNRKPENRCFVIQDNGRGMSAEEFADRMSHVGDSRKAGDNTKLGKIGIGLIAWYDKARQYFMTTGPKEGKGNSGWEGYTRHDLANLDSSGDCPTAKGVSLPELSKAAEWWNTEVRVSDIKVPRLHMSVDSVEESIRSDFNLAMLQNGTQIRLIHIDAKGKQTVREIGPRHFVGQKCKNFSAVGDHCGRVSFEMYRLAQPTGTVVVKTQSGQYTKDWRKLQECAVSNGGMTKSLADALGSGYFEGVIAVDKLEWHFNRQGFKPTDDLAWIDMLLHVMEWMGTEEVKAHLGKVIAQKEEDRELRLLQRVSEYFSDMHLRCADTLYEALTQLPGMVSAGHIPLGDAKLARLKGRSRTPGREVKPKTQGGSRKPAARERDQAHFTVEDDKGMSRYVSRTQSGLAFGIRGIGALYDYYVWDKETGILVINRDHPDYQSFVDNDEKVMAYLLAIAEWAIPRLLVDEGAEQIIGSSLSQMERQYMRIQTDRISRMGAKVK